MTLRVTDGVARLRPDDWRELVESASLPPELAALPGSAEAVSAARQPLAQVQVDVAGERLVARHHAWLDRDAVALLAHVTGEEHQLIAFPPAFLAGAIARLTGIGPHRGAVRRPRPVGTDVLDDLFDTSDLLRSSAFRTLGARRAWTVAGVGQASERRLAAVEDAHGLWLVEPDGTDGWQLMPTDATTLWRRLCTLALDLDASPD